MKSTTIAIDVAKNVFEIAVSQRPGRVSETHRLSRAKLLRFFARRPACTVVLEACTSAHHWARQLRELGHQPVLLPPSYVRPYVRRDKTDSADAQAILEAFRNEAIQPVPVKTVSQQTLTALHRLRSQWLADRTARLNTVRGLLREFGLFIPMGARHVVPAVWTLIEDAESSLPEALRLCRWPRPVWRSEISKNAFEPVSSNSRRWPDKCPRSSVSGRSLVWPAQRHGARRIRRRRPALQDRPPVRQLLRPDAVRTLERPSPPFGAHQQAGQFVPAHAPGPRRPRLPLGGEKTRTTRSAANVGAGEAARTWS